MTPPRPPRRPSGFADFATLASAAVLSVATLALFQPAGDLPSQPAETIPDDAPASGAVTEAVLTLRSGRQITGFIVEQNEDSVVVRINGIDTTFPRTRIAQIRVLPPVAERYEQLRAAVDDDDVRARLALVEWLRARRAYVLALQELDGILEVEPGNPDARTLRDWIAAHLALNAKQGKPRDEDQPEARKPTKPAVPVLSPDDINIIRVFEVDLNTPTRMVVPEETMRTLMTRYPESFPVDVDEREAILKTEPVEQLRLLFEHRARDLYNTVRVLEDPPVMADFKSRVHGSRGWLINACASNRCHGGSEAGRLQLINRSPNSDETAYTNFVILDRFRLADGTALINHKEPARSPLLHMALPRRSSLYPHPEFDARAQKQRWRHVFRSNSDRRFEESAAWIASLYKPRPDYGIDYPPESDTEPEPEYGTEPGESPAQPAPSTQGP